MIDSGLKQTIDKIIKDTVWDYETHEIPVQCKRCMKNIGDGEVICFLQLQSKIEVKK